MVNKKKHYEIAPMQHTVLHYSEKDQCPVLTSFHTYSICNLYFSGTKGSKFSMDNVFESLVKGCRDNDELNLIHFTLFAHTLRLNFSKDKLSLNLNWLDAVDRAKACRIIENKCSNLCTGY